MWERFKEVMWGDTSPIAIPKEQWLDTDPDPADVSIDTAYKTRWIWYHTILALELLLVIIIQLCILVVLAVKI